MGSDPRDVAQEETVELGTQPAAAKEPAGPAIGSHIGRFRLDRHLGSGGMGTVFAAHDPDLERTVAIKLLRAGAASSQPDSGGASRGRERLLREARAMARLSHPNILAVHEVGLSDDLVFIAMEHAPGGTLTAWLNAAPRGWREIVARFIEAGRGLAAAHAAGLVHRDFKPDNTLLMEDGRVCVADFGLVGVGAAAPDEAQRLSPVASHPLMGTPVYMAPEQFELRAPDARADQFSFCVALFEALYGELPFPGRTIGERLASIRAGRFVPPPAGSPVPPSIRAALLRGLSADPAARFPGMPELIGALRADPEGRRRRVLASVAVAAVIAALAFLAVRPRAPACDGGAAEIGALWNRAVRDQLRAAFAATGRAHAADTFGRVAASLDRYGADWAAMRDGACAATHRRGTQSSAILDLRMRCLDDRLAKLRVSLGLLLGGDAAVVDRAVAAVASLDPVADCADVNALSAPLPEPGDPALRARLAGLRAAFAESEMRLTLGRIREATALAAVDLLIARALGFPPALAKALFRLGVMQTRAGDPRAAEALLREAVQAAGRAREDDLAVLALAELIFAVDQQGRADEALSLRPWAEMELGRGGAHELPRAKLLLSLAAPLRSAGRLDEARALLEEAVAIRERRLGPDSTEVAAPLNNLGNVLANLNRLPEARRAFERALAINEARLGPEHPELAFALTNLAIILRMQGDLAGSLRDLERALAIRERSIGDHPETARTLDNLGDTLLALGRADDARRAYLRALAIKERKLRPDHPETAMTLTSLGDVLLELGRPAEAAPYLERALAIRPRDPKTLFALARALQRGPRALQLARDARALVTGDDAAQIDAWLRGR